MRQLIAILVLALAGLAAHAGQWVMTAPGGNSIRLYDLPCMSTLVLIQILPLYQDQFQLAEVTLDRQMVAACWIRTPEGDVYVALADGREGLFQGSAFVQEPGT